MKFFQQIGIKGLILLFFLIRLFGITNPPIEKSHNWRQSTTSMYARNFYEVDNNIMLARVDMAGDLTGITAKEFPLFNYSIYLVSEVFGFNEWYGRLINLVVSSIGIYFFFLLLAKYINREIATYATVILLSSIWFGHGRKIMPDCFSMSLVMIAVYFGLNYLYEGKKWHLGLYFILGLLGTLSKIPSIFCFAIFAIPFIQNKVPINRKIPFAALSSIILVSVIWWYYYWIPEVIETYGFEHYPMRGMWAGMMEIFSDLPETAERFYISAMKSYVGFGLYLIGLIFLFWKKHKVLLPTFLLVSSVFILFMFKAGSSFYHHNYYIVPFVPVMAAVAAYSLVQIPKMWLRILLILAIVGEGIGNQQDGFWIKPRDKPTIGLENLLNQYTAPNDLIAINSRDGNPVEMYFAHRKGWIIYNWEINGQDESKLIEIEKKDCRFLLINKKLWDGGQLPKRKMVLDNDHYWGFDLKDKN